MKTSDWFKIECRDYYRAIEAPFKGKIPNYYPRPGCDGKNWPDGKKLKEGQSIEVKWPDKTISDGKLYIVKDRGSAQIDMNGIPDTFDKQQLTIEYKFHGLVIKIPLKGLHIRRIDG